MLMVVEVVEERRAAALEFLEEMVVLVVAGITIPPL
jgi:hypothetical protein